MSRITQGPFRTWHVGGGATTAEIQAAADAMSAAGGGELKFAPADFTLTAQVAVPTNVIPRGSGATRTRFLAGFSPLVGQADVSTNSLFLALGPITGTVNTTLAARSKIGATTSTLASGSGVAIGQWLEITSVNLADEANCSDGSGNDTVQLIKVLNVAGAVITHTPLAKHAISGSTVKTYTQHLNTGLVDATLDAAGGTLANGFTALRCQGVVIDGVHLKGFSRFGIELGRGTQRGLVKGVHSLGELNGLVRLDAADQCRITGSTFDSQGTRFHANGIPRGGIMLANDCYAPIVVDNVVGRCCIGFWDRKSHNLQLTNLTVVDCIPDEAATRMDTSGEYTPLGARIGIVMTSSGVIANSANPVASQWENVVVRDCSSALAAGTAHAVFAHDLLDARVNNVFALNLGGAAAPGNLCSFHERDSTGWFDNIVTQAGAEAAILLTGSRFPSFRNLSRQYISGSTGEAGPAAYPLRVETDVDGAGLLIDGFSASGFLNIRGIGAASGITSGLVMRNVRWADDWYSGPEGTVIASVNNCAGGAGANGVGQAEIVAVDRGARRVAGFAQFTDATGAAAEELVIVADGEQHINKVFQDGAIMAVSDAGHAMVRSADAIVPGDILDLDTTVIGSTKGKYLKKNNAPAAGSFVFRAQSSKNAGAAGRVLVGKGHWV